MALIHTDIYAKSLFMATQLDVILPEPQQGVGVAASGEAEADAPLPVLYLLHGTTDDHTIWQRRTSIERYVAGKRLAVVMPTAHLSAYANQKYGYAYMDYITEELPEVCNRLFKTSLRREDAFIAGLSMGGYGALKLGLFKPDRYAAAAGLSPGVDRLITLPREAAHMTCLEDLEPLRATNRQAFQQAVQFYLNFGTPADYEASLENNLFNLLPQRVREGVTLPKLFVSIGRDDPTHHIITQRFCKLLRDLDVPFTYEECPGGHEWRVWDAVIQHVLDWLPLPG